MFSPRVLDHTVNPRNAGPLEGATHRGSAGDPGGGPYMTLWFLVEGGAIRRASYETYGCPAAVACGSLCAQILPGRTVAQALSLTPRDIDALLGGLPEGKEHCPRLAARAIEAAFAQGETPWWPLPSV
jgi:nitrogen fixation protein NifU and related proteins